MNLNIAAVSDVERFQRWIDACDNAKITSRTPLDVHRQLRVCRRHFDKDSRNGGCRRLLNTAVPTLFLTPESNVIVTDEISMEGYIESDGLEYEMVPANSKRGT